MSAAYDVAVARTWAEILEDREAQRSGLSVEEARPIVARRTGVPAGRLYSLRRGRLKEVGRYIIDRLGAVLIAELQADLRRIEHDYHTLVQTGADLGGGEASSLLARRQKIREALGLDAPPEGEGG